MAGPDPPGLPLARTVNRALRPLALTSRPAGVGVEVGSTHGMAASVATRQGGKVGASAPGAIDGAAPRVQAAAVGTAPAAAGRLLSGPAAHLDTRLPVCRLQRRHPRSDQAAPQGECTADHDPGA